MVTAGVAMHPATLALQLGTRVDLLVVGAFSSARETGLYSLALSLANNSFQASQTVTATALKRQTEAEHQEAIDYTLRFTREVFLMSLLVGLAAAVVAYPAVALLYGIRGSAP